MWANTIENVKNGLIIKNKTMMELFSEAIQQGNFNQSYHSDIIEPLPYEQLIVLINAFIYSQCIFVVAELKIAELLEEGSAHYMTLARIRNVDQASLCYVLRLLTDVDVFVEIEPGIFQNTELSEYLLEKRHTVGGIRNLAILRSNEYNAWNNLIQSMYTGRSVFYQEHNVNRLLYFRQHSEYSYIYHKAVADVAAFHVQIILTFYDFSSFENFVDIGAGKGVILSAILLKYPHLHAVLFEQLTCLPYAREFMHERLHSPGDISRCEFQEGDFFESVPAGGDIYMLKHILYNWEDENATIILKNIRKVMTGIEKLLIIERVVVYEAPQVGDGVMNLVAFGLNNGRLRSKNELNELLQVSGFKLQRIIDTGSTLRIVEATPIPIRTT